MICPVCFWEDDAVQLRWPDLAGGANTVSLIEGQRNYREVGACKSRVRRYVRPPTGPRDPDWRPIDVDSDRFEDHDSPERADWPDDMTTLYWWTPRFWRPAG